MLNGIDPIILFNFQKVIPNFAETLAKIPVVSDIVNKVGLPPIPIYLSENLTGLFIESEEKSIEVQTTTETLTDGETPEVTQKGLGNTTRITIKANKDSLGLTLLSAMMDVVFEKVTSQEYSITYLHGPVIIFNGLLHSYNITQSANTSLAEITMELTKTAAKAKVSKKPDVPIVKPVTGTVPLTGGG